MEKDQKEEYRRRLLRRREQVNEEMGHMNEAIKNDDGDLSSVRLHMADMATDNYDQELAADLAENEEKIFNLIDIALAKFDQDTYGICERCEREISRQRLLAVPYARFCLRCQEAVEAEEKRRADKERAGFERLG